MEISIITSKKTETRVFINKYPDECPFCHQGVEPNYLSGYLHIENQMLYLAFSCPRLDCCSYFIGEYQKEQNGFSLFRTLLGRYKQKDFSETIIDISSDFVDIYYQASTAEQFGLNQICGVGYRKALEFLIKDYIIYGDNSLKEKVENLLLGKCINDYIKNNKIKDISKRATWLGNDETHYVRKWGEKNISDLKLLIDLTVHWIETEDLTEKIISSMPE